MIKLKRKTIAKLVIIIRLIGILIPQIGYVHPDEFFQGTEIAGASLGYDTFKAWEYQAPNPIRSAAFPLFISTMAFLPLKLFFNEDQRPIPNCLILAMPRLIMFLLSLIHDYALVKICCRLKRDPLPVIVIFGSCYISFVFMIRTFNNCVEASLFTIILCLAASTNNNSATSSVHKAFVIGLLTAIGLFVRPTFLLFAATPICYWLFSKGFETDSRIISKVVVSVLSFSATAVCFVWLDTLYFYPNSDHLADIVITPLNFFMYNSKISNLKIHGLHPRYMHFLVNVPLMFGALGIVAIYQCVRRLPSINEVSKEDIFLTLSWVLPILGLSFFPHQEPRFLIPLLVPLVLLHAGTIYNNKYLRIAWFLGNAACALVLGSFHQGGIVPFLLENSRLRSDGHTTLFFSHTYMVPQLLLQMQKGQNSVELQDLGRTSVDAIPGRYCKQHCLVVLPGSVAFTNDSLTEWRGQGKKMQLLRSYFPHLSTESPPRWDRICSIWNQTCSTWRTIVFQFSLHVYQIM